MQTNARGDKRMVIAVFESPKSIITASNLNTPPAWRIRWFGLDELISNARNKGGASGVIKIAPLVKYTEDKYGYLFELSVNPINEPVEFYFVIDASQYVALWNAEPLLAKLSTPLAIALTSIPFASITRNTEFAAEVYSNYVRILVNGSEYLRFSVTSTYILDAIGTGMSIKDSAGSTIDYTDAAFVEVERLFDVGTILPIVISVAVTAAVVTAVIMVLTKGLK